MQKHKQFRNVLNNVAGGNAQRSNTILVSHINIIMFLKSFCSLPTKSIFVYKASILKTNINVNKQYNDAINHIVNLRIKLEIKKLNEQEKQLETISISFLAERLGYSNYIQVITTTIFSQDIPILIPKPRYIFLNFNLSVKQSDFLYLNFQVPWRKLQGLYLEEFSTKKQLILQDAFWLHKKINSDYHKYHELFSYIKTVYDLDNAGFSNDKVNNDHSITVMHNYAAVMGKDAAVMDKEESDMQKEKTRELEALELYHLEKHLLEGGINAMIVYNKKKQETQTNEALHNLMTSYET